MARYDTWEESEVLSLGRQKYVIGVFVIFYIFAYMGRNISLMSVEPIKLCLRITDVQFSLIQGLAFGAFYAMFGLPMGWIVDCYSKRWVVLGYPVLVGITCFSAITPLIAIANSISTHIQLVTPGPLRGRIAAITVAAQHLCGIALGPLLVAIVTDKVFADPARVGHSMAIVAVLMAIPTLYLYGRGRKYAREAVLHAEAAGR